MVLTFETGVIDHGAGVGGETGHGATDMGVDFDDFFDGRGFEEDGGDAFFDAEDDSFGSADAYGGGTELHFVRERWNFKGDSDFDCFNGIFDLEETAGYVRELN